MPVIYEIDPVRSRIHTRCVGAVLLAEVIDHFGALSSDPNCPPVLDVLLDISQLTTRPDATKLRLAASEVAWVKPKVRFEKCAILAGSDEQVVTGILFKRFADAHFSRAVIFTSAEDAERWLSGELDLGGAGVDVWR